MPSAQGNTRNSRKRTDLLDAVDTFSSHLQTTFVTLSSALAQERVQSTRPLAEIIKHDSQSQPKNLQSRIYVTFIVGSSPGAAKAHVVLVLDGFEVEHSDHDDKKQDVSASDDQDPPREESLNVDEEPSVTHNDEAEDFDSDDDGSGATEPPSSRTPSPSPPPSTSSSPPPSPPPLRTLPRRFGTPLVVSQNSTQRALSVLSSQSSTPRGMPPPDRSYAADQQRLRVAERLLSRTLANANAEGSGLSAEFAATQTHVFLRAPRRFSHPAWKPRQNYTRSLEGTLQTFMAEASCRPKTDSPPKKGLRSSVKTEGVWITCGSGSTEDMSVDRGMAKPLGEEDEMIWWEWDGKLVGFSEW